MLNIVIQTFGGLGIFLVGMVVMTDGLRGLAGRSLRAALMHYTRTPGSGAFMGALTTAVLQSSSATSLAVIGFVGAELMSFTNALGVLFGANIGTTITGWLVALLGFKLKLITLVLPLIFLGALLRLFSQRKAANAGYALAGFGLIFVGIATMQEGMSGLEQFVSLQHMSALGFSGRLLWVLGGIVFTVITQSSSAGVAASLSALHADLIGFDQAAALVIGMDIGTTVTALIATIGASIDAKRTGYSHVIYNLMTGLMALFMLPLYVGAINTLDSNFLPQNAEIGLVLFHSTFNIVGVLLILPFTRQFAQFIETLVTDRHNLGAGTLDARILDRPELALNAEQVIVQQQLVVLLQHTRAIASGFDQHRPATSLEQSQRVLDDCHRYLDQINLDSHKHAHCWHRLIALMHSMDHLQRLHERCEESEEPAIGAGNASSLEPITQLLDTTITKLLSNIDHRKWLKAYKLANHARATIHQQEKKIRDDIIDKIGLGELDVTQGTDQLRSMRWLKRVSTHIARITAHLQQAALFSGP